MKKSDLVAVAMLLGMLVLGQAAEAKPRYKAVVFDYLVLFDANSIIPAAESAFPGRGAELVRTWRSKQFEYGFLRSITGRQTDFLTVTSDALVYAADSMKLGLSVQARDDLLRAYLSLKPWPDAAPTIRRLKRAGLRVVVLSNFSPSMLRASAEPAGLAGLLDDLISTQQNGSLKPEPRAYALAAERLGLQKSDVLFVAFGGWDAYGAQSFGYPTYWVNRFDLPVEHLGLMPDATSGSLAGLLSYVSDQDSE